MENHHHVASLWRRILLKNNSLNMVLFINPVFGLGCSGDQSVSASWLSIAWLRAGGFYRRCLSVFSCGQAHGSSMGRRRGNYGQAALTNLFAGLIWPLATPPCSTRARQFARATCRSVQKSRGLSAQPCRTPPLIGNSRLDLEASVIVHCLQNTPWWRKASQKASQSTRSKALDKSKLWANCRQRICQ